MMANVGPVRLDRTGKEDGAGAWTVRSRTPCGIGVAELVDYWPGEARRINAEANVNVVEALLDAPLIERRASFPHIPGEHVMGEIALFPARQPVSVLWPRTGAVRALRCYYPDDEQRHFTDTELTAALAVNSPAVRSAVASLVAELCAPGFQFALLTQSLMAQIAVELGRYFRRPNGASSGGLTPGQMMLIDQRIMTKGKAPTADELAEACRVSKRHFFRLFRRTTGSSPAGYAAQRRIERAKTLLREDQMVVKQIAYSCGFETPSAFSVAFRRHTGMSPREYRNSGPR